MPVAPQPSHGYFYPRSPCGERLTILLITVTTLLFLSTLSLRRATTSGATYLIFLAFLSTLSLRRATEQQLWQNINTYISIHALLAESDISQLQCIHGRKHFYPRSPCGERLFRQNYECFEWIISIHALLAESDGWSLNINGAMKISIHALLAESDRIKFKLDFVNQEFLSTLSLRRATDCVQYCIRAREISIHALLAESDGTGFFVLDERHDISIHALLAESDTPTLESLTPTQTFLSTLSLRRATRPVSALYSVNRYFYPRSPCGERRHFSSKQRTLPKFLSTLSLRRATVSQHSPSTVHTKFLSTLSLRRATIFFCSLLLLFDISIHALLAESDLSVDCRYSRHCPYFYPRSPCGERHEDCLGS